MDPNTASVFGGVVPKDGLPKTIDALPTAFVCNTDDGDEPGEHWIALYLSSDGRGEYFCSYGLSPLHAAFSTFLNKHCSEWTHNSKRLQSPLSNVCGQYCVAYIMFRCNGSPMRTFVNAFRSDLVANDCRVFDWLNLLKKVLSRIVLNLWRFVVCCYDCIATALLYSIKNTCAPYAFVRLLYNALSIHPSVHHSVAVAKERIQKTTQGTHVLPGRSRTRARALDGTTVALRLLSARRRSCRQRFVIELTRLAARATGWRCRPWVDIGLGVSYAIRYYCGSCTYSETVGFIFTGIQTCPM